MIKLKEKFKAISKRKSSLIMAVVILLILVVPETTYILYTKSNTGNNSNYKTKYEDTMKDNQELKNQISSLETEVSNKNAEINTKNAVIEKIQNNYNTLNQQIDKLISTLSN